MFQTFSDATVKGDKSPQGESSRGAPRRPIAPSTLAVLTEPAEMPGPASETVTM